MSELERTQNDLGSIPGVQMHIQLKENSDIRRRPYPIPEKLKEKVQAEISRLIEERIIKKCDKPTTFASPAFPIVKKNGDIRLVVDYRELNRNTIRDTFPFPNLWEQLQRLGKRKIFSQLDLRQGYHQIALTSRASEISSFVLPGGQYQYLRVPFGLTNAPRVFQ